jgi:hypothetical protein
MGRAHKAIRPPLLKRGGLMVAYTPPATPLGLVFYALHRRLVAPGPI